MSISSISSGSVNHAPAIQPQDQTPRVGREKENDGDSDDGRSASSVQAKAHAKPSVNTSGQVTGTIINTKA